MAIYMSMPGVSGSTSALNYNQWIPLLSIDYDVGRIIETVPGRVADRIQSNSFGTEMEITKPVDQASPLLFGQVCGAKAIAKVQVDICYAAKDSFIPYLQYILSNVLVSEYSAFLNAADGNFELITLNYTDMEISVIPYNALNEPESPNRAQAQVGCHPSLATNIRRKIRARTPEGFNLFVATVYGEAGGVRYGNSRLAWQAVGSVIINRIHSGIWHRYLTSDDIIKHTGFDAFVDPNKINWNQVNFKNKNIRSHQQFLKAWATLNNNQKINHHNAMTFNEKKLLDAMQGSLFDIYYNAQPITIANYYYSPRSMPGKQPSFLSYLKNPEQYRVLVPGVHENDFKFYYISAHLERTARKN